MLIEARVENERGRHTATLTTNGAAYTIPLQSQSLGFGSRTNGGELLCLALATCYCNDIYREAAALSIEVVRVEVDAFAEFGGPGLPASRVFYRAVVVARTSEAQIRELILHTDRVAEIHNTLRKGIPVQLESFVATSAGWQ